LFNRHTTRFAVSKEHFFPKSGNYNTEPWGTQVTAVEIKDITLPDNMQRAMAKEAEAERERRAKIVAAEGEFQAAVKLGEAADIITQRFSFAPCRPWRRSPPKRTPPSSSPPSS
jgi:hypothetical protein